MINELDALRLIGERFSGSRNGIEVGIGDDAAALRTEPGKLLLVTTDCQVEDVHFVRSLISPEDLARKSVAVSVSDVGAMGGAPKYILASLGYTKREDGAFLEGLMRGFESAEEEFGVRLVGGNLSSSEKIFLDMTVLGFVDPECVVTRKGASPGDVIYVSGTLGDSALGLGILKKGGKEGKGRLVERHLRPKPRLELGKALADGKLATAMIDVSDGLALDLTRITVAHGVGARVGVERIPLSGDYRALAGEYTDDFYGPALSGGEDYELLFTSPPERRGEIKKISDMLNIEITEIGDVSHDAALTITDSGGNEIALKDGGFVHSGS
ncbi:MAG TPA: thiamine-phosphate kinase [Thermodesulfobacteriota bacterium]|nr:thiamine-phosphate kinase [Thermodesulfobacteriota bacterium]